ncbi:MAG: hypothetical protein NTW79_00265, partial [Candidatus Berkelbacteria bacterium]|nr:hypothetical protein [Candidatus Berkelbacteria bacterium]
MADLSVKKTAASPWDEELPEEVEKNAKPTVVGDLDGGKNNVGTNVTPAINNQPSENVGEAKPLTVPAEVTEEVGAKVPAEEIVDQTAEMTADVPVAVPPTPEPIKPTTPSSDIKMPPTIRQTANVGVSTAPTINDRS